MEYNSLLHDFIDGNLDPSKEQELFYALASNEELRRDLKSSVAIDKSFAKRISSFAPSVGSTGAIFDRLGIEAPKNLIAPTPKSGFSSFFKRFGQGFYGVFSGAAVTAAIFLFFLTPKFGGGGIETSPAVASESTKIESSETPIVSAEHASENRTNNIPGSESESKAPVRERIVYKTVYVDSEGNRMDKSAGFSNSRSSETIAASTDSPEAGPKETEKVVSKPDAPIIAKLETEEFREISPPNRFERVDYFPSVPKFFDYTPAEKGFSGEYKGAQSWSVQKAFVNKSSENFFDNSAIALSYRFSDRFSAGLDFRSEFFYQEFEGNVDDSKFLYRQYPSYKTLTAFGRYKFYKSEFFDAFAEAGIGYAATGMLGRFALATEVSPDPGYGFLFGVETSALAYEHQGTTWFSPKIGLIYGVKFNM